MPRRPFYFSAPLFSALIVAPTAWAADNPGAHEHGHARLQLAVEDTRVELIFTSPAHNLAGFEHAAKTDAEKHRLANVRQWLSDNPLINTTSRDCVVDSVEVTLGSDDSSHGHDAHRHDNEHSHHDEEQHDHEANSESHRDYEVSQQLQCNESLRGAALVTPLLAEFPALKELDIEWVSPEGQGSLTLETAGEVFTTGN